MFRVSLRFIPSYQMAQTHHYLDAKSLQPFVALILLESDIHTIEEKLSRKHNHILATSRTDKITIRLESFSSGCDYIIFIQDGITSLAKSQQSGTRDPSNSRTFQYNSNPMVISIFKISKFYQRDNMKAVVASNNRNPTIWIIQLFVIATAISQ